MFETLAYLLKLSHFLVLRYFAKTERFSNFHISSFQAPPRRITTRNMIEARYEVGKVIGDGNFAVVRECRLRNTESEFAMKIIDKSKLQDKADMIGGLFGG